MIQFLKNLIKGKKSLLKNYIKINIDLTNGTAIISSNSYDVACNARRIILSKLIHEKKKQERKNGIFNEYYNLWENSKGFFTIVVNSVHYNISTTCSCTFLIQVSYGKEFVNLILELQEHIKKIYEGIDIDDKAKKICKDFKKVLEEVE